MLAKQYTWIISAILISLISPITALAADSEGLFAIKGAGVGSCEHYVEKRQSNSSDFFVYAGWIDGYLTALNRFQDSTYDLAPWQTSEVLAGMVSTYCNSHPSANFANVVDQLAANLAANKLTKKSPLIRISNNSQQLIIYAEVLARVKESLKTKGHLKEDTSPEFNDKTAKAITNFQKEKGLQQSGLPNYFTLYELFK